MKKNTRFMALVLTALMVLSCFSFSAFAQEAPILDMVTVEVDSEYYGVVYFTPSESGWYEFFTEDDYYDASATLYDGEVEIGADDDAGYGNNFSIKAYLYAGTEYQLLVDCYESEYETVYLDVFIKETVVAVDAVITQMPYNTTVYAGVEYESINLNGLEIEFSLSDGTTASWSYEEYNDVAGGYPEWDFYYDDEYEIYVEDGKTCIWLGLDSGYVDIEFDVVENPVDYIDIDLDSLTFTEGTGGYFDEYYNEELDGYYTFYYYDFYDELEGAEVTIYYKDGTKVTTVMDSYEQDEYVINASSNQYYEPWYVGGDNYIYIEYMGAYIELPVEIVPSKVKDIEVTKDPAKTVYEGRYYPIWDGAQITVTLNDGTKKSVVASDKNTEYSLDSDSVLKYTIDVDGYEVEIFYHDSELLGEYYELICQGTYTYYYGFEFTDSKTVNTISVENFNPELMGDMKYIVKYTDGTARTFKVSDIVCAQYYTDYTQAYIKSAYGIAWCDAEAEFDSYDDLIGYYSWFHGEDIYIDAEDVVEPSYMLLGDVDENGKVNVRDATTVQKSTASMITLSESAKTLADVDSNGKVNVRDATAIQKWIAGIDTGYPIGQPA